MSDHDYQESRGLVTNRRTVPIRVAIDPLGLGISTTTAYETAYEIFDLWETETKAEVTLNGELIKESFTVNDFYGFNSAQHDVVLHEWANKHAEKFPMAQTSIIVSLNRTVSFAAPERKKGFYHGSVECSPLPRYWKVTPMPKIERKVRFAVWQNTERTRAADRLERIVAGLWAAECSNELRYDPEGAWARIRESKLKEMSAGGAQ